MFNRLNKLVVVIMLLSLTLVYNNVYASIISKNIVITTIPSTKVTVKQNENYKLPKTVLAIMNNKSKQSTNVTWNRTKVDTSKVYTQIYQGTVKGYKGKVELSVSVIAYIKNIENINLTIKDNGDYVLPKVLAANMSDNSIKDLPIDWSKIKFDDKIVGVNTIQYMVEGYNKPIDIVITVDPTIISINDMTASIKQNQEFNLPAEVEAKMSNGSTKRFTVQWDKGSVDTKTAGKYVYIGKVSEYAGSINLAIDVNAYIENIVDMELIIKDNGDYQLPKTLTANMSDGGKKEIVIDWNKIGINDRKLGVTNYPFSVEGYEKSINLKITVVPTISNVKVINKTIKVNMDFILPNEVIAEMTDGTTTNLPIIWDANNYDIKKAGIYNFAGKVPNYKNIVNLVLTVEGYTVQDVASENKKVLLVKIYDSSNKLVSTGSGFIISQDGKLVTNYHVIDGADHIQVIDFNNQTYDIAYVVNYDKKRDIAILKINSAARFEAVAIGNSDKLELGQQVVAIGSPLGLQNTVSSGLVSSIRTSDRQNDARDIQISVPISHGSSGGALFNMNCEVVGITYAGISDGQNLNFAIPINEIKTFATESNLSFNKLLELEHPLLAPSGLTARAISSSEIQVQWNQVSNVDGYYVYLSADSVNWSYWTDSSGNKKLMSWNSDYSATLTNVPSNSIRYFKVTAVRGGVESQPSNIVTATTAQGSINFPLLSSVPIPNWGYDGYTLSDDKTVVFYEVSLSKLPNGYSSYYRNLIESAGWVYYKSKTMSDGTPTLYYTKGKYAMGYTIMGDDFVIFGEIH